MINRLAWVLLAVLALFCTVEGARAQTNAPPLINNRGTTTPANCTLGQLFFDTDATAGTNIYGCTTGGSPGTWTLMSGAGGSITAGTTGQCAVYTAATVLGGVTCASLTGTPAAGDISYWTAATTQALFTPNGSLILGGSGSVMTNYAGSTITAGQLPTAISATGALSGTATPTLGASGTVGSLTLGNATSGTVKIEPVTGALGTTTLRAPAAAGTGRIAQVIASGAKALATSAISSAACSSAQTDTATGTLTTDAITVSFNGDPTAITGYVPLTAGMLTIIPYPTADTVNFKVCNNTGSSITPGAVTLNWHVTR